MMFPVKFRTDKDLDQVLLNSRSKQGFVKSIWKHPQTNFLKRLCWNLWEDTKISFRSDVSCKFGVKENSVKSFSTRAENTVSWKVSGNNPTPMFLNRFCWNLLEKTKISFIPYVSFEFDQIENWVKSCSARAQNIVF